MKEVHLEVVMPTQRSPCIGCKREEKDKRSCASGCEVLRQYQATLLRLEEAGRYSNELTRIPPAPSKGSKKGEDIMTEPLEATNEATDDQDRTVSVDHKKICSRPDCENEAALPNGLCRKCHGKAVKVGISKRIGVPCKEPGCDKLSNTMTGRCSDCHSKLVRKRRKEKKQKAAGKEKGLQSDSQPAATSEPKAAESPHVITLDFSSYPEVLERVRGRAKAEIRPVENQVIFMLREGMAGQA